MGRLGVLAFAVIWWTTAPVPMPVTAIAALAAGVLMGALSINEAFAAPTNWVTWFVIGSFGMSAALERTGFNRRFALMFLNARITRGRPHLFLAMFLLSAAVISTVLSSTIVAIVWLSLATTIFAALKLPKGDPFAEIMTIGVAWAANVGGVGTPAGTATNVVAMGLLAEGTGTRVSFLAWSIVGMMTFAVIMAIVFLTIRYLIRPDFSRVTSSATTSYVENEIRALGPMTTAEKWSVAWGLVAMVLWSLPDLASLTLSAESARLIRERMDLTIPALVIPVIMCLIPVGADRRPVLTWEAWARGVEWGMVVFMGSVLVISTAVAAPNTGIPDALKQGLAPVLGGLPEYGVVFVLAIGVVLVTGVISNLVTLTVFLPLGLAVAKGFGQAHPAALAVILGMGASLDYLLPSGTTTNAIVAGSGWMRVSVMLRYGLVIALATAIVLTLLSYPLAKLLLG